MKTIREAQLYALDRLGGFLADLEHETDELKIVGLLYVLASTARSIHQNAYVINGGDLVFHLENEIRELVTQKIKLIKGE